MSVWTELVGQQPVVDTLSAAVASADGDGRSMTHAWLFTGPPGSGRSNAARAFAAALQCEQGGCGECQSCRTVAAGSHPDVTVIATAGLSIGIDVAREHVRGAALRPAVGRWQVMIVEDADRLTEPAANALLKAIEEPTRHAIWMLCAPALEDVVITIRSRCRPVLLRTPPAADVARLLVERDGVEPELAAVSAAVAQGHVGRARGLARDPEARARRRAVLEIPVGLRTVGDCVNAAAQLVDAATAQGATRSTDVESRELDDLKQSWGVEERGRRPAGYAGALSSLEKEQKRRRTRAIRDAVDAVLLDLLSLVRDVAAVQVGAPAGLVNADAAEVVHELAGLWTPTATIRAIDAIVACREALTANAALPLAVEHLMLELRR